ncbi:MAG: CRISPR-associated protein Csx3 [bacterium]
MAELTYIVTLEKTEEGDLLKIRFGADSQNDKKVVDAQAQLEALVESVDLGGGEVIRVNGPASLPVAMTIAHAVGHIYQAVACNDPKVNGNVVAIAHGDKYAVGQTIPA